MDSDRQQSNNNNQQNGLNPNFDNSHSNLSSGVNDSLNLDDVSLGPVTVPETGSYHLLANLSTIQCLFKLNRHKIKDIFTERE